MIDMSSIFNININSSVDLMIMFARHEYNGW